MDHQFLHSEEVDTEQIVKNVIGLFEDSNIFGIKEEEEAENKTTLASDNNHNSVINSNSE
ncbi:hypothetical protein [Nitrosopumilus sp.]|uniref:hypothetical protein n=1 Tax=Nitrosopumilus sp. TaxID=2024843 RepID=UPI00292D8A67|nr:hypothetical protein [Nitrosopumilus sp.]